MDIPGAEATGILVRLNLRRFIQAFKSLVLFQLLVITSTVSAFAVLSLLGAITVRLSTSVASTTNGVFQLSAWNTRNSDEKNLFVRSHAAWYLISLLVCDMCQGQRIVVVSSDCC